MYSVGKLVRLGFRPTKVWERQKGIIIGRHSTEHSPAKKFLAAKDLNDVHEKCEVGVISLDVALIHVKSAFDQLDDRL